LPRLRWRAEHSLERLRAVGFDRVGLEEGIDARQVDARAIGRDLGGAFDPRLSDAEGAGALSMLRLWERILVEGRAYLLLFHDDVLPHPDVASVGESYWADTPTEAAFVLLGNRASRATLPDPMRGVGVVDAPALHAHVVTQEGARTALGLLRDQISRV